MGSQKLSKRQSRSFRLAVPKTIIECGYSLRGEPAPPDRCSSPNEFRPQPANIVRVFADQIRRDLACMGEESGATGALGIAKAQAGIAIPRSCLNNEKG